MSTGFFKVPNAVNEPVYSYAPGTIERKEIKETLKELKKEKADIPMYIGGKEIKTGEKISIHPPHEIRHTLGHYHKGNGSHVKQAIAAALKAKKDWENLSWEHRASVFLKAADLISGPYRARMNAATMLCQSKNIYQAEIDAACESADFCRFNVKYMTEIFSMQPDSTRGMWNRMEYRPLEGFVFAVSPFNFTSIAFNLPCAPALFGNTVVWKPANTTVYSANMIMEILREAGLPDGVINLVYADGSTFGDIVFDHPDFSGIHFTGSTSTFHTMWKKIGGNIHKYKSYPRIVGETGGKDFVIAHPSASANAVVTALARGAFEYQGQKCSAASRAYIPSNLWKQVKDGLTDDLRTFKMGPVEDFRNFINAVIDEKAFDSISGYIDRAKKDKEAEILLGGKFSKKEGYFIEPTVIKVSNPGYSSMCEEIFGPVLSVYVYDESRFDEILKIADETSPYALTGAIFAQDRKVIESASRRLRNAAGNYYINDKPTGAMVGQQPFGGARGSGTNDKAGSMWNLIRWVSPRLIKETFVSPIDYRYPFMEQI